MGPADSIRLLLADDHYVVRMGIKAILSSDAAMIVVAEAENGPEALAKTLEHRPDVVLMDVRMPSGNGIEATRAIRAQCPGARVVMLTTHDGDEDIHRALEAGAHGYLLKNTPGPEMIRAIREVRAGGRYLPPAVARRLAEREPCAELSPKQLEVLALLAKGLSNREIGGILGVSENTAKTHVKAVMAKLDVNDRTEATVVALERGILHLD